MPTHKAENETRRETKMPVKQNIPYNDRIYFLTITSYKWLPLIEQTNSFDTMYKWFGYLKISE